MSVRALLVALWFTLVPTLSLAGAELREGTKATTALRPGHSLTVAMVSSEPTDTFMVESTGTARARTFTPHLKSSGAQVFVQRARGPNEWRTIGVLGDSLCDEVFMRRGRHRLLPTQAPSGALLEITLTGDTQ